MWSFTIQESCWSYKWDSGPGEVHDVVSKTLWSELKMQEVQTLWLYQISTLFGMMHVGGVASLHH